jgi:signal transduction histidine kinase
LTGGVAHNFNNILTAVLGGVELVLRRLPENPNITPLLQGAIESAQRGVSLTRRMMAFGRRQDLKPELIVLQTLIQSMMDVIQQTLGSEVSIDTNFPETPVATHVDVDQLELAVINLIMNARDSMPDGGSAVITILPESTDTTDVINACAGRFVCLSVADTGEGMDGTVLSRHGAVFLDQRDWQGNRAGPVDGIWICRTIGRQAGPEKPDARGHGR